MSVTHILVAVAVGVLAYIVTGLLAKAWVKRGDRFTLKLGRDLSSVVDAEGNEVFSVRGSLSYRHEGDALELTAVGEDANTTGQSETVTLGQLADLPRSHAVQLFAAFALYCLVRARKAAAVPVYRYATLGFEMDEEFLPIVEIAKQARQTRALRHAGRDIVVLGSGTATSAGSPD